MRRFLNIYYHVPAQSMRSENRSVQDDQIFYYILVKEGSEGSITLNQETFYYFLVFDFLPSSCYCDDCGNKLRVNSRYTRFISSSHGIIAIDSTYWTCSVCKKHFHNQIIGVPSSAKYGSSLFCVDILTKNNIILN